MSAPATANLFAALDTKKKKKKSKVRLRFLPTPKRPLAAGARARRSAPASRSLEPCRLEPRKIRKVAAPQSHPESPPLPSPLARSPQEDKKDKKKDKKEKEARENLLDEKLWEGRRGRTQRLLVGGLRHG